MTPLKPRMTFWQIVNMNIGFFGIQFSFGLQQSSMSPIYNGPHVVHSVCLVLAGAGMLAIPHIHTPVLLLVPMVGIGLAWASIMGNPYVILASSLPPERTGVYMGIFNMFIVIPMIIQIFTLPLYYHSWLGGNPENVIRLAGVLLVCAAVAVRLVRYNAGGAIERTEDVYADMERDGDSVRRGAG